MTRNSASVPYDPSWPSITQVSSERPGWASAGMAATSSNVACSPGRKAPPTAPQASPYRCLWWTVQRPPGPSRFTVRRGLKNRPYVVSDVPLLLRPHAMRAPSFRSSASSLEIKRRFRSRSARLVKLTRNRRATLTTFGGSLMSPPSNSIAASNRPVGIRKAAANAFARCSVSRGAHGPLTIARA